MSFNRRSFIRGNALIAGTLLLSDAANALASVSQQINTVNASIDSVNIFHTNDMQGQVSTGFNDFGGLDLFRKSVNSQDFRGILLDGGGFLGNKQNLDAHQNFIEIMNQTGYHASTIGHAELRFGQEYLAHLVAMMTFDLLNCNYEFSNPILKEKVKPYMVFKYGKHRVGVTGVGPKTPIDGVFYKDPSTSLSKITELLKKQENCSVVICLAHLGFEDKLNNNMILANNSEGVDFVIGGNSSGTKGHGTSVVKNKAGYDVFVSHTASHAKVFNHTSFAANKVVDIRSAIPGRTGSSGMNELATLTLSSYQNQLV
jgi:5'-nucleotidase